MEALLDAQTSARSYAISGKYSYLASLKVALVKEQRVSSELRSYVVDNVDQVENVDTAKRDATIMTSMLTRLVELTKSGRRIEAIELSASPEAARYLEDFRGSWERILTLEERLLVSRQMLTRARARLTVLGAVLLASVSFALLVFSWSMLRARQHALGLLAMDAQERLRSLSEFAAALSQARTKTQVVDVVLDQAMPIAAADTCTIYVLNDTETKLDLLGQRGIDPDIVEKIRSISASSGNPNTIQNVLSGVSLWAESEADYLTLYPDLANMKVGTNRARAFWSVPMFVEGKVLGLFAMGYYRARKFSNDDRMLVGILSRQCAQALQRATRMERENQARIWFGTTLRSIGDAVIATDPEGQVSFMNQVAEQLTGYSESEAINRHLDDVFRIISDVTREAVESPVSKVLREGAIVGLANHTVLLAKSGLEIPIADSGAPIRNEEGGILGVVMVFRDVTQETRGLVRREFLTKAT